MVVWRLAGLGVLLVVGISGCGKNKNPIADFCADDGALESSPTTGAAYVFKPDPMTRSGIQTLSPGSSDLDSMRDEVVLDHLGGHSVLEGKYVDVRDGNNCAAGFGAHDIQGKFLYPHSDPRFQEAMTYYFGDSYRAYIDSVGPGLLVPKTPVQIVAHCGNMDNAYFQAFPFEYVCLGDSVASPGASYADDASVTIHELEHATTVHTYSPSGDMLGAFPYDEAGALNEAISDFMAMMYTAPLVPSAFDPLVFSRWALGSYRPGQSSVRGARKCPMYDASYPKCDGFPNAFSASGNHVSYSYPDGLGWPFANNYQGPAYVQAVFKGYPAQEEIHNAGVLATGAMWDVFEALVALHGAENAEAAMTRLILRTIANLPKPGGFAGDPSPAGFQVFGETMAAQAASEDSAAVTAALTQRGLVGWTPLSSAWAAAGPGAAGTPGVRIFDNPDMLKSAVARLYQDPSIIRQGIATGLNSKLDAGETTLIWFDIRNTAALTAGGVKITAQISPDDGDVKFLDGRFNAGAISAAQAEIRYGKVNGTAIVQQLTAQDPLYSVPTGNSYFLTNPNYDSSPRTALWITASPSAAHGKTVTFQLQISASNGPASTVNFPVVIN